MCHPGRPGPNSPSHRGSPGRGACHSSGSTGLRFARRCGSPHAQRTESPCPFGQMAHPAEATPIPREKYRSDSLGTQRLAIAQFHHPARSKIHGFHSPTR